MICRGPDDARRVRSYAMNAYVGWQEAAVTSGMPDTNRFPIFLKSSQIIDPGQANLLLIEEVDPRSID